MRQISRRTFLRLSSVATAGVMVAACAEQREPAVTPEAVAPTVTSTEMVAKPTPVVAAPTSTTEGPTPAPEPTKRPWPREDVSRSRTFIWVSASSGSSEFPDVGIVGPYATGYSHQGSHAAELEPLYYYSAFADKTYSWLAQSHAYNDDATELTFWLRKEAAWSDGTPFTAADVAFTVQMLIDRAPDLRNSGAVVRWVKQVEVLDNHTVKLTLHEPNWRLHFHLFTFRFDRGIYIVPKHIYEQVEEPREFTFFDVERGWPVVTGAYQTVLFEPQRKYLDLRYDWWASKAGLVEMPRVERIVAVPFTDFTVVAQMVVSNEVDCCLDVMVPTIKSILEQAPQVITHSGREPPYGYVDWWPVSMFFNPSFKPYDDPRVRWAMAYAIDQQQLVDVAWMGAGETTNVPYPCFPPLMPYIDSIQDLLERYDVLVQDLGTVEELMGAAGFARDGDGFWADADGVRPDADIYAYGSVFGDLASLLVEQLRRAGFDARHVSPLDVWGRIMTGDIALWLHGHTGSVIDPYATLDLYHSGSPLARWSDPQLDAIVEEMSLTPMNDPRLMDQFRQAMAIWLKALPEVPLVQWYHRIPMNTTYWTNWPTDDNPYINEAPWHLTFPLLLWNLRPTQ